MSYGAACGQLRKRIMFSLLQELNRDICYRCGKKIETVDELSIEHKKFWLRVDVELFWNLDNITFSHLNCNNKHRRIPHKITPPDGYSWCSRCSQFKLLSEFPTKYLSPDGRKRRLCTRCRTEVGREQRKLRVRG